MGMGMGMDCNGLHPLRYVCMYGVCIRGLWMDAYGALAIMMADGWVFFTYLPLLRLCSCLGTWLRVAWFDLLM